MHDNRKLIKMRAKSMRSINELDKQPNKLSNRKYMGEDEENNSNLAFEET